MVIDNIDRVDTDSVDQLDPVFVEPLGRMQPGIGDLGVAAQEFLAERRSGVRQRRIVGQDANRVIPIVLTKSLGRTHACRAASDDDQSCRVHV
jgi:hypothetical protein